jgi:hypothetical protein
MKIKTQIKEYIMWQVQHPIWFMFRCIMLWCPVVIAMSLIYAALSASVPTFANTAITAKQVKKEPEKTLTISEHVWKIMDEYDLTFDEKIDAMSMLNTCENKTFDPYAVNVNLKDGKVSSLDIGLWQFNTYWYVSKGKITKECAYDVYCSTRKAMEVFISHSRKWTQWTCGDKLF